MDPHRLPRSVIPRRYDLTLRPDLEAGTFTGLVLVHVDVLEPTTAIWLNAAELQISDAHFYQDGLDEVPAIFLEEPSERCRLSFATLRPRGQAVLALSFTGTLNDKLRGFYRSRFRDPAGDSHWLAATQFEATDARRAFPCWDEPDFKAVFAVSLVVAADLTAISNTRILHEQRQDNHRVVRFADTMPMSTYLVAIIVGPLEASEAVMVGQTPVRVWCVPGKKHLTRFGHDVAVFSLAFFENYYGRAYPADKLDLLAIPDFAAGAMENLGAITFRETALLIDESKATHQEMERIADVVSHENAHMWFGDLVTMRWWNGLWLNEAFATFMEMLAVDGYRPDWQRWTTFGVSRSAALAVDGLRSSRSIEFPVAAPQDAEAMFDVLTYEKGASVLRMLEQYIGPEVFRAGVRLYLERHAFGNTETTDLWNALAVASGLPIPDIMDGWIFRPGYPVLQISRQDDTLHLRQERFCYLLDPAQDSVLWQVPVQIRIETSSEQEYKGLLLQQREVTLPLPDDTIAVVINQGGHGFYRVRYAPDLLAPLLQHLPTLANIERYNLINDVWAGVLAGHMDLPTYLDLTRCFETEGDRNVWSVLLGSFTVLARIVDEPRAAFEKFVRDRLTPATADLGWQAVPGEHPLTGQLRGELLRALGTLGEDAVIQQQAEQAFASGRMDASVQAAVIAILAHTGDEKRHADFLGRFRQAQTPQEEQRYLQALALFRPRELVEQTLTMTLDGTVRTQDSPLLLRSLLLGIHSRELAWQFLQANWDEMARRFPGPGIRRLCEGILGLTSAAWLQQARTFFQERKITLGGKTLEQFLEQLQVTVELRQRQQSALRDFLLQHATLFGGSHRA